MAGHKISQLSTLTLLKKNISSAFKKSERLVINLKGGLKKLKKAPESSNKVQFINKLSNFINFLIRDTFLKKIQKEIADFEQNKKKKTVIGPTSQTEIFPDRELNAQERLNNKDYAFFYGELYKKARSKFKNLERLEVLSRNFPQIKTLIRGEIETLNNLSKKYKNLSLVYPTEAASLKKTKSYLYGRKVPPLSKKNKAPSMKITRRVSVKRSLK